MVRISSRKSWRLGLCVRGGVEMKGRMERGTQPGKPDSVVCLQRGSHSRAALSLGPQVRARWAPVPAPAWTQHFFGEDS